MRSTDYDLDGARELSRADDVYAGRQLDAVAVADAVAVGHHLSGGIVDIDVGVVLAATEHRVSSDSIDSEATVD